MNILQKIRNKRRNDESAVTIAEIMVASAIIVVLLIASAQAFAGAISANVASSSRNQAIQISQDVIAIAKQAPIDRLALKIPGTLDTRCSEAWTGTYNGVTIRTQATEYPKLTYCDVVEGTNGISSFVVYTYVTGVSNTNFDNSSTPIGATGSRYIPKRVTVKVVWLDKLQTNGSVTYQSVIQSYVRTPTIAECIPQDNYGTITTIPPGCG